MQWRLQDNGLKFHNHIQAAILSPTLLLNQASNSGWFFRFSIANSRQLTLAATAETPSGIITIFPNFLQGKPEIFSNRNSLFSITMHTSLIRFEQHQQ